MWPFILSSFLAIAFTSSDTLMIKWMIGAKALGLYQSGLKLVEVIIIIPTILAGSIYPFAAKFKHNIHKFSGLIKTSTNAMLMIGLPILGGGILLSSQILILIFSNKFLEGTHIFKYIQITGFLSFFNLIFSNSLIAAKHEKKIVKLNSFIFILNIIFNLIFIPTFGVIGAVIGSVTGSFFNFIILTFLFYKLFKIMPFNLQDTLRYIFCTTIMIVSILIAQEYFSNVILLIMFGALNYIIVLYLINDPIIRKIKSNIKPPIK